MSYAVQLLSQGLLYLEFHDAIKEGDDNRIIRCWRYFMLIFKARRRKNYSIEALHLLTNYHFFSESETVHAAGLVQVHQHSRYTWKKCAL